MVLRQPLYHDSELCSMKSIVDMTLFSNGLFFLHFADRITRLLQKSNLVSPFTVTLALVALPLRHAVALYAPSGTLLME